MKRIVRTIIPALLASLCLLSCNKQNPAQGEGQLKLRLSIDQQTKAAYTPDELMGNATVNIYKADFSGLVRSYKYSQMPQSIYLPADAYRVDVIAGEMSKENPAFWSWEQKSYKGSAQFEISPSTVNNVQVEAKVSNVIAQVTFDSTMEENLNEGYFFRIGLDLEDKAQYTEFNSSNSGAELYFNATGLEPALYWEFCGVRSKTGATISKSGVVEDVKAGTLYKFTPCFIVKDGDLLFDLVLDSSMTGFDDIVVFEPVSSGLIAPVPADIWATKAIFRAEVDESLLTETSSVKIAYASADSEWVEAEAERYDEGYYSVLAKDLEPECTYFYKLLIDGVEFGDPKEITTCEKTQVPNASFEVYSNDESSKFKSFYDPAHALWNTKWWDNGNQGSTTVSASNAVCVPDTSDKVDGECSAKCASQYVVIKFAAGSISSCEFAGTEGLSGGKVNFGRPFTARPSAISLWIKYKGGLCNRIDNSALAKGGITVTSEDQDRATFIAALGTWSNKKYGGSASCPVQVNTTKIETLYKYDELPETIAYGYHEMTGEDPEAEWQQLIIPFEYYRTDEIPTHIILSFAASKYGDFFTGCDKSTLWVDNVELLYE